MSTPDRPFLEVSQSVTGQTWRERLGRLELGHAQTMADDHGIEPHLARVIAARGVLPDDAADYLNPTLRALMPDPSTITDMDAAAARLLRAIEQREEVAIFGDYDVDGATSSALLARFLRACGIAVRVYIPDRIFEGYGPNDAAIRELIEAGAGLIVAVDCGSTSHGPFDLARSLGADVVVLDHHQVGTSLPQVEALVNPNRDDDLSGQGHLCAVGVVFMALVALNRLLRNSAKLPDPESQLMDWLDLVALGTVCDVVPLKGLNRAFVARGIEVMHKRRSPGLVALSQVARQDGPAAPWHLGFLFGPRINAGGRIGDASLGAKLLMSDDPQETQAIAEKLDQLNSERQAMEQAMLKQAIDEADAEIGLGDGPAVLVTESEGWHAGVVGLLASRLKDKFRRPAFAIAFDHRGVGAGSGRSIPGIDLGATVRAAVDGGLLEKGGGHAMAAGITINRARLGDFRSFLEDRLSDDVEAQRENRVLKVDAALGAGAATTEFVDLIEQAGPFGAGNSQPVFAFPNHRIRFADVVGANHVRFSLAGADRQELRGIAFRAADEPLGQALLQGRGQTLHFAGTLTADFYRGSRRVQLRLLDAAPIPDRV